MDSSNWSTPEIEAQKETRVLVIDFVNKKCVFATTINNFAKQSTENIREIESFINEVTAIRKTLNTQVEKSKKIA